jgi:hypothetical protein
MHPGLIPHEGSSWIAQNIPLFQVDRDYEIAFLAASVITDKYPQYF